MLRDSKAGNKINSFHEVCFSISVCCMRIWFVSNVYFDFHCLLSVSVLETFLVALVGISKAHFRVIDLLELALVFCPLYDSHLILFLFRFFQVSLVLYLHCLYSFPLWLSIGYKLFLLQKKCVVSSLIWAPGLP